MFQVEKCSKKLSTMKSTLYNNRQREKHFILFSLILKRVSSFESSEFVWSWPKQTASLLAGGDLRRRVVVERRKRSSAKATVAKWLHCEARSVIPISVQTNNNTGKDEKWRIGGRKEETAWDLWTSVSSTYLFGCEKYYINSSFSPEASFPLKALMWLSLLPLLMAVVYSIRASHLLHFSSLPFLPIQLNLFR